MHQKAALILISALSFSCEADQKADRSFSEEVLEVEGRCRELHAIISAEYKGEIVKVTKDIHEETSYTGQVARFGTESFEKEMSEIALESPTKYHPPDTIVLIVSDEDFHPGELALKGNSVWCTDLDCKQQHSFEARCNLRSKRPSSKTTTEDD